MVQKRPRFEKCQKLDEIERICRRHLILFYTITFWNCVRWQEISLPHERRKSNVYVLQLKNLCWGKCDLFLHRPKIFGKEKKICRKLWNIRMYVWMLQKQIMIRFDKSQVPTKSYVHYVVILLWNVPSV